jgi:hypothetical protein
MLMLSVFSTPASPRRRAVTQPPATMHACFSNARTGAADSIWNSHAAILRRATRSWPRAGARRGRNPRTARRPPARPCGAPPRGRTPGTDPPCPWRPAAHGAACGRCLATMGPALKGRRRQLSTNGGVAGRAHAAVLLYNIDTLEGGSRRMQSQHAVQRRRPTACPLLPPRALQPQR